MDGENMFLPNENVNGESEKSKTDALGVMSENEMEQHMQLCLKLAAENKINAKNAFGLHLIKILQKRVRTNVPDLQFASLSLQASSKIYAGRVEALYRDTFAFHNQLQTIVSNEKGEKGTANMIDNDDEEGHKEKRTKSKPKQTYLTNEDNVSLKSEANYVNTFPHANFITMKSAFNASRTSPSLLDGLPLENDSCKMCCSISLCYFQPQVPMPVNDFLYPEKRKNLIRKVQKIKMNHADPESTVSDVFYPPEPRTPPANPDFDLPSDDSFCIGTPAREEKDEDVQEMIEKFSILDITADLLVNDLSLALVNGNTIDSRLLPPNSALKKVFGTPKTKPKTPAKPRKERPPKEPFFGQRRNVDWSILKKGRKIDLTDNNISEWQLSYTTQLHCGGHDKFSKELAGHYDEYNTDTNDKEIILRTTYKLIQEHVLQTNLENYFLKSIQLWNHFQHRTLSCLVRPSSFGVCLINNSQGIASSFENSNSIVQSLENLSLHNSPVGSDDFCLDANEDNNNEFEFSPEMPMPMVNRVSRLSCFEDDLKSVMVTPPELVKTLKLNFQTEPITLSTEKVKNALWNVIEKNDAIMLSDLHKKLKLVFIEEKLPLQYVFTMLLLLANEKCLLLETLINGADVQISKDILETY